MHMRGTTAAVERAFGVQIGQYSASGEDFYSADKSPSVPSGLPIAAVHGLADFWRPRPDYQCLGGTTCGLFGSEFRELYDVTGSGAGETIAFTAPSDPISEESYETEASASKMPLLTEGPAAGQIEYKQVGHKIEWAE